MVGLGKGTLAMLSVTHLMVYHCSIIKGDSLSYSWVFPMKALETKESDHSFCVSKICFHSSYNVSLFHSPLV